MKKYFQQPAMALVAMKKNDILTESPTKAPAVGLEDYQVVDSRDW